MSRIEYVVIGAVLGFVPPVLLGLAGWWSSLSLAPEPDIWRYALAGLVLGTAIDVLLLPRWIRRVYALTAPALLLLYAFYTVGVFGFFMGVPIFNLLPGMAVGLYVGRRMRLSGTDTRDFERSAKNIARLTTGVMLAVCTVSALLAMTSSSTASDLKGLLHLRFEVTRPMIVVLILVGGTALLVGQYWMTQLSARRAFRRPVVT